MILIESALSGIWATLFMDFLAKILAKRKLIYPFVTQEELGRWFIYLFKGKITHKNICKTLPVRNEKKWYFVSHYLIGIALAGFYLILSSAFIGFREYAWLALVFGILTLLLPWFWLLPSIGLGFIANKSTKRTQIIKTNIINHTNFGFGIFLWIILLHNLFLSI